MTANTLVSGTTQALAFATLLVLSACGNGESAPVRPAAS